MLIHETTFARSGLIGNPSDIFEGKVISFLFNGFSARVTLYESPRLVIKPSQRDGSDFANVDELVRYRTQFGYYGGVRLIEATIIRFKQFCDARGIHLEPRSFTVEYDSDIPFGVGLGGSSAIARAILGALMRFNELSDAAIPLPIQPTIILEAETQELGISAGPQDRVVAVYGGLMYMDFTPEAMARNDGLYGDFHRLDPAFLPPLYIAWAEHLSKSSGAVHNTMRYRAQVEHDPRVLEVMRQKVLLVDEARSALEAGRKNELGRLLDQDFDLRKSVYQLSPGNLEMVAIARQNGSHANNSGSGGAVVGTWDDELHLRRLAEAFSQRGYSLKRVGVVTNP